MAPIDAEWLETFVVFSQSLNLTHAAKARHLSQPAVHLQISKLAEAVGAQLYRRSGRRLELTEAGRRVARFGLESRERTEELAGELRSGVARRPVVLAAGEGSYLYVLGDAVQGFVRENVAPLRLLTRDRSATVEAVESGAAHLGVAVLETQPEGLESEVLAQFGQVLVVPSRHALARRKSVRLVDLKGERLIVPPATQPHRMVVARALQSAGVDWEVSVEAGGWALMMHFVRLGLGVAIVNGCCTLPKGLSARPMPELPRTTYSVLHRAGLARHPGAQRLRKMMIDATRRR